LKVKASNRSRSSTTDAIEITIGENVFTLSEPIEGQLQIDKSNDKGFVPIEVHPRYGNQIILK
jgi:hypothetical protein